ncbi:MAG TPA: MarR family transcriptional regulator [Janthinobacterium sp.]|nr:MarR family transcriptional regulator [Janthinobacterium sp.]
MFFLKDLPTRAMLAGYHERFPAMNVDKIGDALRLLRQASLLMRALDAYFATHELSQLRFLIMMVLDREGPGASLMASEVAARLDVSRPVMTRTLQAMEKDGLLSAQADTADGRAKLLSLCGAGQASLLAVLPGYYAVIEAFMDGAATA